jgi:hypothetical protein
MDIRRVCWSNEEFWSGRNHPAQLSSSLNKASGTMRLAMFLPNSFDLVCCHQLYKSQEVSGVFRSDRSAFYQVPVEASKSGDQILNGYRPEAKRVDLGSGGARHLRTTGAKHIHAHTSFRIDALQHDLAGRMMGGTWRSNSSLPIASGIASKEAATKSRSFKRRLTGFPPRRRMCSSMATPPVNAQREMS